MKTSLRDCQKARPLRVPYTVTTEDSSVHFHQTFTLSSSSWRVGWKWNDLHNLHVLVFFNGGVIPKDMTEDISRANSLRAHLAIVFAYTLSDLSYTLTAHLHYGPDPGVEPATVRNEGVPGSGWVDDEIYLFYNVDGVAVEHEFPDKNIDDDEVSVIAETGFSTMRRRETITREISNWRRWWFRMNVGGKYKLLMPHGYIGWWDYGPMEVRSSRLCKSHK